MKGVLYVVATPIGNLEDITLRALKVLKEVDLIAAEDTRHTLKLLTHYGIRKKLVSYWSGREKLKAGEITARLDEGLSVALVSDAGTPGISDPGGELIRRAIEQEIEVVAVPGPSASVAALSISGLDTREFVFIGFLPAKKTERAKKLAALALEERTLVFYEAPHRLLETLSDMITAFTGGRRAVVVKEITKIHEETIRGSLEEALAEMESETVAGEYVIAVAGREKRAAEPAIGEALAEMSALMKKGLGRKEAAKSVARSYGLAVNELYERSLKE
ncbi:MAG: 16S rRNA (cytidine(1402)-2'-O)-methyltransferase [Nitrospiraceae bacterium]|nr:16S rRNA (cytidine(1402)-2'-O)-methyltransferase [Nitrospiraceae bacterium]